MCYNKCMYCKCAWKIVGHCLVLVGWNWSCAGLHEKSCSLAVLSRVLCYFQFIFRFIDNFKHCDGCKFSVFHEDCLTYCSRGCDTGFLGCHISEECLDYIFRLEGIGSELMPKLLEWCLDGALSSLSATWFWLTTFSP